MQDVREDLLQCILPTAAPSPSPWSQEGLELPGQTSDSSGRNADTIAPQFGGFFFVLLYYIS